MKKLMFPTVSLLFLIVVYIWIFGGIKSDIRKEKEKYKVFIGQKFVLEKDTLIIVDYSMIQQNFTLSNGKEVNENLVFNNSKSQ